MGQVDAQRLYDELVSLCYDSVLDESRWPELVSRLMSATGRQQGGLMCCFEQQDFVQISEVNLYDGSAIEPYNQHYCHADPGHLFMPQRAVGSWYHDFVDYGMDAIKRSAYYQEFHRNYGLGHISSVKLYETPTASAYLSLVTNSDAKLPSAQQQALLARISPHLIRVGRLSERIQHLQLDLAKRDLILDNHATPLWLLDGDRHVLYSNHAAQQRLSQKCSNLFEDSGRLHCAAQDSHLQYLVRQAVGLDGRRRSGWLRLNVPSKQELLVTPVPAESALNAFFQRPLVLLALLGDAPRMALMVELFQLTPAEQRLAELLGRQISPESCAVHLNVSINTVRSQLRALLRKTDTSRQAELMGLIGRLHG